VRRKPGKKLLVCDNLSSHISVEVIELCEKNNIAYVFLPLNAMDKMQPLDVGVFGPMKHACVRYSSRRSKTDQNGVERT
jgi:hypothetical protein